MNLGRVFPSLKSTFAKVILVASILTLPAKGFAADTSGNIDTIQPRNAVSTILMSGLVGGILGLSTLSFYDRPQDNIRNITIGAGLGMISAALYMTYSVSQKTAVQASHASNFEWAPKVAPDDFGLVAQLRF